MIAKPEVLAEEVRTWLTNKQEAYLKALATVDERWQCHFSSTAILDALIYQLKRQGMEFTLGIAEVISRRGDHHVEHFITVFGPSELSHFIDGTYRQFDPRQRGFIVAPLTQIDRNRYYQVEIGGKLQPSPLLILSKYETLELWSDAGRWTAPLVAALLD